MVLTLTLEHLALGNGLVLDGLKLAIELFARQRACDGREAPKIARHFPTAARLARLRRWGSKT